MKIKHVVALLSTVMFNLSIIYAYDHVINKERIVTDADHREVSVESKVDLNGSILEIPAGYKLRITEKGALLNGTLKGHNTIVEGCHEEVFSNIHFEGTWMIRTIRTSYFSKMEKDNSLVELFSLCNENVENVVVIEEGTYYLALSENDQSGIIVPSNTEVILNGIIKLKENGYSHYNILDVYGNNVSLHGRGEIIGDKSIHTNNEGEWGMGLRIRSSDRVCIYDISISNCWGDCVYIGYDCGKVYVNNCKLHNSRRQGISITSAKSVYITNCEIYNIIGTAPQHGIDIEPNANQTVDSVFINNTNIHNCMGGILVRGDAENARVGNVNISHCVVDCIDEKRKFRVYNVDKVVLKENY